MPPTESRRLTLATLLIGALAAACGGSSTPAPTSVPTAPLATTAAATPASTAPASASAPSGAPAAASCPSAAIVDAALGVSLPEPVSVPGGGGTPLPAGATGVACEYHGTTLNVIIELIANIDPSAISSFSSRFPVAFTAVSGVGDQARSFHQALNGGKDNEGVVATKGRALVDVTATATPASLAQVEALVAQLL